MNRERQLLWYCAVVGACGWLWLVASRPSFAPLPTFVLFFGIALAVEATRLRVSPNDPHSLVGIVHLTAAFVLGPAEGALVAACSGLVFGVLQPLMVGRPPGAYVLFGRPFLRSGVRAIAVLSGAALATAASGNPPERATYLLLAVACYPIVVQLNRVAREYIQGGRTGVASWWRGAWRSVVLTEIGPLPAAWLGAAIYQELPPPYFVLGGALLLATSFMVRQASLNIQRQRRSVRELALLNQVSRAIIRSSLDVTALCELIYSETSKVVDTSSFHLGLFEPGSDMYTLMVRVQDRLRLPAMSFTLETGDGLIGWMRETGQALLVHDFEQEMNDLPARPRYQSERPPRSGIYVPLIAEDHVIGSISIQSYLPNIFDANDLRLLSLIADQAAVAILKARTFDEARERAVQLQAVHEVSERITAILDLDELLQSVVQLIRERFGYHPVHIFTLEPGNRLLFRASTAEGRVLERVRNEQLQSGDGLVGAAASSGQPVLVNDVRQDPRYINETPDTRAELTVPLRFGDQTIGVLDVQSAEPGRFADGDLFVMQTLAGQIAVAIESARAYTAQREEAWTLNALLQVAENTAWAESLDDLLAAIVRLPPLLLGCDRCYCLLYEGQRPAETRFRVLAAYGITPEQRASFIGHSFAAAEVPLLAEALSSQSYMAISSDTNHPGFGPLRASFGGGSLLALPLTARAATLGILVADYNDPRNVFTSRALTLYMGIASQVAGTLESALLAQQAAEAARLDQELRVARDIQTALLPARPPVLANWDLAADWRSARLVGGDFYDFWLLKPATDQRPTTNDSFTEDQSAIDNLQSAINSPRLGFVIADVSDKGVPAAMFMTLSRSLLRAAALDGSSPAAALERANRWITRDSDSAMFVTLFYGLIEPDSGRMCYSCAGHNPPLLVRATDGSVSELATHDIALGVLEDATLHELEVTLAPGDLLVCYTDGITEAINDVDEPFGVPRLQAVAVANRQRSADEVVHAITDALLAFTGERQPFDDLTLVVVKHQ